MKAFIAVAASVLSAAAMAGKLPTGVVAHDGTRIWVHGARTQCVGGGLRWRSLFARGVWWQVPVA
ncbi:hypothetical protein XCY_003385 [Xanthomonas euroxanthea]|jgi:hypothetical protein|uniref:hypothetical protein n=1 Tax=Xanthomonas euroxanthea TaxID=2259622 RepID=UPI000E5B400F|nr:hypothetical protein [Xanthomonas euroxanthea]MBB3780734.1 hypothetical protein [Xanthomonas euroxanthea]CAG2095209.1 hypothetical protein XCY_003385 [Xanthomonas euroxanthea]SYZ55193.1 hypothetical protein CPBF367_26920 [Xanthomonas arboricola pv. juglandis]